jgi:2-polyprenyl-3-methyl-5-hydroxy-6-metoxy-1,4-benzoquinol methylase
MNQFESEHNEYQKKRNLFWENAKPRKKSIFGRYYQGMLIHIYQYLIPSNARVLEIGCAQGDLLAQLKPSYGVGIDFSKNSIDYARIKYPYLQFYEGNAHHFQLNGEKFDYIVLSDLINDAWDIQEILENLKRYCHPQTRIIFNFYSHLWSWPLKMARLLRLASPILSQNWLTKQDLENLLELTGFVTLRSWQEILVPAPIPFISTLANRYLAKLWPFWHLDLVNMLLARPNEKPEISNPSISVVVAARNEAGHIEQLINRIPKMGSHTEIVFVEGNSSDDTYDEINLAITRHPELDIKLFKQTGKGKGDAVRLGFEKSSGDILIILDADITVPPEDLPRFYNVLVRGDAEFVNGVRLVYPMEDKAMRFLNLIGNKFFSYMFSWLLGQPIRDTLCGTKALWKNDYDRIAAGRKYFGDFDPFGDFDLIFGAAKLNLKIMEVPIRYRARVYGETNISRWSHGLLLLRMVAFAAKRIKFT